jgi:hypothetical protein
MWLLHGMRHQPRLLVETSSQLNERHFMDTKDQTQDDSTGPILAD